jgi:hypothetical protein
MLGQVPFVKERFEVIVVGIVLVSVMPMVVERPRTKTSLSSAQSTTTRAKVAGR